MIPPYSTTTGPKHDTRQLFGDAIREYIPNPSNILLMPGEDAHDARLLKGMFPRVAITGLEADKKKAETIKQQHHDIIKEMHDKTVAGYSFLCKKKDDPSNPDRGRDVFPRMDAIWLDHTGSCTESNVNDIIELIHYSAKKKSIFAATFTANPRGASESMDIVIKNNAWLEDDERYDPDGQRWSDVSAERRVINTCDKVANAVRTAIEKGFITHRSGKPWEKVSYQRLEVLNSMSYRARENSSLMHFFILAIEKF